MPLPAPKNINGFILNYSNDESFCFWTHRLRNFCNIFRNFHKSVMDGIFRVLLLIQDL